MRLRLAVRWACLAFGLALLAAPQAIAAGDLFVGIRTWAARWSPGVIQKQRRDAAGDNRDALLARETSLAAVPYAADDVAGFYAGPLISYVTENRDWSFNFVGSSGKSGLQGFTRVNAIREVDSTSDVFFTEQFSVAARPERQDLDFTVAYALGSRFKVFAGFKQQSYNYDVTLNSQGSISIIDTSTGTTFALHDATFGFGGIGIEHSYSGPAGGVAYSHPISDRAAVSLSVGYFSAKGTSSEASLLTESNGRSGATTFAFTAFQGQATTIALRGVTVEITATMSLTEQIFAQFGYRGQFSRMDVQYTWDSVSFTSETIGTTQTSKFELEPYDGEKFEDRFQGFSFSLIYRI